VRDLDMALLHALHPRGSYTPDFIDPPPRSPLGELEDELEEMLATPPERVRFELRRAYEGRSLPPILEGWRTSCPRSPTSSAPTGSARSPRCGRASARCSRATCLYRARQLADGGAKRLFADIHPEVSFAEDTLRIDMPYDVTADLGGRGLLFVPSAFTWPRPAASVEPPWQPFLVYPARGVGGPVGAGPLRAAGGARRPARPAPRQRPCRGRRAALDHRAGARARALPRQRLPAPVRCCATPASVHGHRVGRSVLYVRSEKGEALVG
jgi:hypothetical protein